MNKPWWLWKEAAVRESIDSIHYSTIGEVHGFSSDGTGVHVKWTDCISLVIEPLSCITPIENPAVILAPKWAKSVCINDNGNIGYISEGYSDARCRFNWPQCPDHLKGHTWELPK